MSSPLPELEPEPEPEPEPELEPELELDRDAADRASERDPVPGPEPRWLSDEEQRHWRAYLRGSRLLEVALDQDLQSQGVQLSEYELISMLSEAPGDRLRMSVLADLIVQSRSRVTHTAARLEKRGWVRREACLEDRRGVELVLTDAGRAAVERMARVHVESVRRHLLDAMPPEQFVQLGRAMQRIRQQVADEGEITGGMAD